MQTRHRVSALIAVLSLLGSAAPAQEEDGPLHVLVSVAEQRLMVVRDGMWVAKFPVSTSKFGEGDGYGSYKTPLGRLRICAKIGAGLPIGSVMHHRNATGEILRVNARGRDPIVTRIMWLEGLEAQNQRARSRGIYIHGTVEESKIGRPVSYGCVRMRSHDVVELFDMLPVGTVVTIQEGRLPRLKRWSPPPVRILAAKEAPKPEPAPKTQPKVEEKHSTPEPVLVAKHAPHHEKKQRVAATPEPKLTAAVEPPTRVKPQSRPEPVKLQPRTEPAKPMTFASAKPVNARAPIIIRSNGWAEDARPSGSSSAAASLKGSILFADLPGQE